MLCILNAVSTFAATVGNSIVLISVWRTLSLRRMPSYVLLSGLAVSDLGVGLVVQPSWILVTTAKIQGKCLFSGMREILELLAIYLFLVSFLTLTAMGVDRFLALRFHLRYLEIITVKRVYFVLGIIWAISGTFPVWKIALGQQVARRLFFAYFLSVLLLTSFCYFKIFKIVRRHQCQIERECVPSPLELGAETAVRETNNLRCTKSVFTVIFIFCLYMVNYVPWICVCSVHFFVEYKSTSFYAGKYILVTLMHLNSVYNPALFYWRLQDLREAVNNNFKVFCWRNR